MKGEPTAVATAVTAAISALIKVLVIAGVVDWSAEQTAAIMLVVDGALAAALLFFVRARVTPTAEPTLPAGASVSIEGTEEKVTIPDPLGSAASPPAFKS